MDFIRKTKNRSVVADKSLWGNALMGFPMYGDLLNVGSYTEERLDGNAVQNDMIRRYPTREDYVLTTLANGTHRTRGHANAAWDAAFLGYAGRNRPANYIAGNIANSWDAGHRVIGGLNVPNTSFWGTRYRYVPPTAPLPRALLGPPIMGGAPAAIGPAAPGRVIQEERTIPNDYYIPPFNEGTHFNAGWIRNPQNRLILNRNLMNGGI